MGKGNGMAMLTKAYVQRAVGYVRVSTTGQAVDGVSLAAQRARIEAWSVATGSDLAAVHVDAGLSGGRADNRPGLQAAITEACATRGALVVYSLSRLARSTRDAIAIAEKLERSGADLVSLTENIDTTGAVGKLFFRMMAALAEFERDQIAERTTDALRHKKRNGERVGRIPFGSDLADDGVRLIENPDEQRIIAMIESLRSAGISYRAIAAELHRRGIAAKGGGRWHASSVRHIAMQRVAA